MCAFCITCCVTRRGPGLHLGDPDVRADWPSCSRPELLPAHRPAAGTPRLVPLSQRARRAFARRLQPPRGDQQRHHAQSPGLARRPAQHPDGTAGRDCLRTSSNRRRDLQRSDAKHAACPAPARQLPQRRLRQVGRRQASPQGHHSGLQTGLGALRDADWQTHPLPNCRARMASISGLGFNIRIGERPQRRRTTA